MIWPGWPAAHSRRSPGCARRPRRCPGAGRRGDPQLELVRRSRNLEAVQELAANARAGQEAAEAAAWPLEARLAALEARLRPPRRRPRAGLAGAAEATPEHEAEKPRRREARPARLRRPPVGVGSCGPQLWSCRGVPRAYWRWFSDGVQPDPACRPRPSSRRETLHAMTALSPRTRRPTPSTSWSRSSPPTTGPSTGAATPRWRPRRPASGATTGCISAGRTRSAPCTSPAPST